MRSLRSKDGVRDWTRLALKLGLVLTDPKIRAAIGDEVKGHFGDVTDTIGKKYADATDAVASKFGDSVDGLKSVSKQFTRGNPWPIRATGFLLGAAVGAGLGILLAPASGSTTRQTLADKTVEMKDKLREAIASSTERSAPLDTGLRSTG
jgi:hypothetical protein